MQEVELWVALEVNPCQLTCIAKANILFSEIVTHFFPPVSPNVPYLVPYLQPLKPQRALSSSQSACSVHQPFPSSYLQASLNLM